MSAPIAVLRPEPGNRVTAAAIETRGRTAIRVPLFETRPLAWEAPNPAAFDALILTSANAVRHGGAALGSLTHLPVHAVGAVTAEAARRFGFTVVAIGDEGAATLVEAAQAAGVRHALHLAGREHTVQPGGIVAQVIPVYASDELPVAPDQIAALNGAVAMVHSARAAVRLASLIGTRANTAIAAISPRAADAAGSGWAAIAVAPTLDPEALLDTAIALAD